MATDSPYDDVLIAVDGSQASMNAARKAVQFAERNDATLHALYVMDVGDAAFVATPSDIAETRERLEDKGNEYTAEVEDLAIESGLRCVKEVRSGIPTDEIADYVDEHDVDLVVLGKRGRSDPDKPLLGSITRRVTAEVDVPVFTV